MKTRFSAFICVLMLMLIVACTYDPVEFEAEVESITPYPKYYCTGEEITISFESKFADKVTIRKRDGTLLLEMIRPNPSEPQIWWHGRAKTPPMREEWRPLSVVVRSDQLDDEFGIPFPEHKLKNIDQPEWAGIYQDTQEILSGQPYNDHVATTQEWDSELEEVISVKHYDVKQDFCGFIWWIPYEHSDRATLMKIVNYGTRTMTFTISGIPGEFQLDPGQQTAEFQVLKHPSGRIEARYDPPETRIIGRQKGEYSKPENEHYSYTDLYQMHVSAISLLIRCGDE
jgi:hypothetical protein